MVSNIYGTTIVCVKKKGKTVIAGDGQISLGNTILKSNARKLRTLDKGKIVIGFAGSVTDSLTLFERLQAKLSKHSNHLVRSATELAKDWRQDKYLRRLEAMMIVADKDHILILSGNGDIIEPEDNIASIGSGSVYASAAAKAFMSIDIKNDAQYIAKRSLEIAAEMCVYTSNTIILEEVK